MKNESDFYEQTKQYYDECAEYYDYLYPDHIKYSKKLFSKLESVFRENNVKKILDASCGVGHDMSCLLEKGFNVDGADVSLPMINKAKNNLREKGYNDCFFFNLDVRDIADKIGYGKYDAVIFRGNTFSNILPNEEEKVFEQIYKLLKTGGIAVIDFRSGIEQFNIKRKYELRGFGVLNKALFFSYYNLKHSISLNQSYKVNACIYKVNFNLLKGFIKKIIRIRSFYVNDAAIIQYANKYFIIKNTIDHNTVGLPYLKTIICVKDYE